MWGEERAGATPLSRLPQRLAPRWSLPPSPPRLDHSVSIADPKRTHGGYRTDCRRINGEEMLDQSQITFRSIAAPKKRQEDTAWAR
jgi:hypothetical protein